MGIEGHRHSGRVEIPGAVCDIRQYGLVTEVDTVEVSDAENGASRRFVVAEGIAKDLQNESAHHRQADGRTPPGLENTYDSSHEIIGVGFVDLHLDE